jgi:hypothetical protein
MKNVLLLLGFLVLFLAEILKVYFIMPFPGSQQINSIDFAYFLHNHIWYFRGLGIVLTIWPLFAIFQQKALIPKWIGGGLLLAWIVVFYLFNFRFLAEKMFYQPKVQTFTTAKSNKIALNKLIVGVVINKQARAYPIQLIGYHHQVVDTLGGEVIMVTYCTVCRTGRVYMPKVNSQNDQFRLVGMDHFNALFEDQSTGSWWQQATGEAIAGPQKGQSLPSIASEQMTLSAWLKQYPDATIMQPDEHYKEEYDHLQKYDQGKGKSTLTKRDSLSWQPKSWVVGIKLDQYAKAYDWNVLLKKRIIQDSLGTTSLIVVIEKDNNSFHVFKSYSPEGKLHLVLQQNQLIDTESNAIWSLEGKCIAGKYAGTYLPKIQAYQEFWHSWQTFHPQTLQGQ